MRKRHHCAVIDMIFFLFSMYSSRCSGPLNLFWGAAFIWATSAVVLAGYLLVLSFDKVGQIFHFRELTELFDHVCSLQFRPSLERFWSVPWDYLSLLELLLQLSEIRKNRYGFLAEYHTEVYCFTTWSKVLISTVFTNRNICSDSHS